MAKRPKRRSWFGGVEARDRRQSRYFGAALLAAALAGCGSGPVAAAVAADGKLDPKFGDHGRVITSLGSGSGVDGATGGALLPGGRILTIGGNSGNGIGLVRYRANGAIDGSFNGDGIAGSQLLAGYSFGSAFVRTRGGRILVTGAVLNPANFDVLLEQFTSNGDLDPGFGTDPPNPAGDGIAIRSLGVNDVSNGIARDSAGRSVVVGRTGDGMAGGANDFFVLRHRVDGSLDPSFNGTGILIASLGGDDEADGVTILRSGRILVAGISDGRPVVLALKPNGKRDKGFGGGDGLVVVKGLGTKVSDARLLARPGGRILLMSNSSIALPSGRIASASRGFTSPRRIVVVRLLASGKPDKLFGGDGIAKIRLPTGGYGAAIAVADDGRIVIVGGTESPGSPTRAAVWRLLPSGSLDRRFGRTGLVSLGGEQRTNYGYGVLIQPDRRILLLGETYESAAGDDRLVVRLLGDTVPPQTRITKAPPGLDRSRRARFKFRGRRDVHLQFRCSLTGPGRPAGFRPCRSPAVYGGLDGPAAYTFRVRAIDRAGNVDHAPARRHFFVAR